MLRTGPVHPSALLKRAFPREKRAAEIKEDLKKVLSGRVGAPFPGQANLPAQKKGGDIREDICEQPRSEWARPHMEALALKK